MFEPDLNKMAKKAVIAAVKPNSRNDLDILTYLVAKYPENNVAELQGYMPKVIAEITKEVAAKYDGDLANFDFDEFKRQQKGKLLQFTPKP